MAVGFVGPCLGLDSSMNIVWDNTVPTASGFLVSCVCSGVSQGGEGVHIDIMGSDTVRFGR
jgi:hypothetical protein